MTTVGKQDNAPYRPTMAAAFNHPRWATLVLTPKQENRVGCQLVFKFSKDANGKPVGSYYAEYKDGAIPMQLEVFRATVDGYQMRLGIDLPEFLCNLLGESVTTTEGQVILI